MRVHSAIEFFLGFYCVFCWCFLGLVFASILIIMSLAWFRATDIGIRPSVSFTLDSGSLCFAGVVGLGRRSSQLVGPPHTFLDSRS